MTQRDDEERFNLALWGCGCTAVLSLCTLALCVMIAAIVTTIWYVDWVFGQ